MSERFSASGLNPAALFARPVELFGAAFLVAILALIIFPFPAFALDLFICANFCISFLILSSAIYINKPAQFTAFPSILLLSTLLRLALAVASTRMILLHAHAGQVIQAFGSVVAGSNIIVGLVVFVLLCLVQFIVVAKGADRVAEVSARFTLDGIPGRQMSIDADLRSGAINAEEARDARRTLEQETYLYGSLDGAMKFVKGDAIAGLVVALVNIVAGLAVGITMRGMAFHDALSTYTILTVGDGIVSQVPSLMVTIAAGIVMTRVTGNDKNPGNLWQDISVQLASHPKALMITAAACLGLAAIPHFATLAFSLAGLSMLGLTFAIKRRTRRQQHDPSPLIPELTRDGGNYTLRMTENVELGTSDPLRLRLSQEAMQAINQKALGENLAHIRMRLTMSLGLPFPGLSTRIDHSLSNYFYALDVEDITSAYGTLVAGHKLVSGPVETLGDTTQAIEGRAPDFRPAIWIANEKADSLSSPEHTVYPPEQVLCEHLEYLCRSYAERFMGTQEAQYLLDQLAISFPELVTQMSSHITPLQLSAVLRRLLHDQVAIRNMRVIVEAIAQVPQAEMNLDLMVRAARIALGIQICSMYADPQTHVLHVAILESQLEFDLESRIRIETDGEPHLRLSAEDLNVLTRLNRTEPGDPSLVLTTAVLRPHLAQHLERLGAMQRVIALEEVSRHHFTIQQTRVFAAEGVSQ
ncbi:flagellar biosynthesis protein FlhA [Paraburkholderia hayleyella]|uniref:flagellar biosynthesis protein FlhA n=1 Tax=Paraburkholderia hayleyella TaxID=2152889 RepID=UPI001292138C|nr:flagellar biosynthesis protein FlhA [Paraburkholderia hayleyella]